MRNFSALLVGCLLLSLLAFCQTPTPAKATYMQIFYEGSSWLAGREVLHYSPAFRGKLGEVVREDSTRAIAPGALLFDQPNSRSATGMVSVADEQGTYVRGADGKMRLQTEAEARKEQAAEKAHFDRGLNLVEARAALGRTTLTNALNAAAADGWEVVQLTSWGTQGGLVYLLRRR